MNAEELNGLMAQQRSYFESGRTRPTGSRIVSLHSLKQVIRENEEEVFAALRADLGKSRSEAYMTEVGMVYSEIDYMIRHIRSFGRTRMVRTSLGQFPAVSYRRPTPKGVVLVMSPWNYPFLLTLEPMVDALAAGNTVVLKPSAYAPQTAAVIQKIIAEAFHPGLVCVVTGGRAENQLLLEKKFDHIFFTGSQAVGREVMHRAADHLTPVTLELGGKSPCIVDHTASIPKAARRIVFGKFLNCGQTCVAPDYILCQEENRDRLVAALMSEIHAQLGKKPLENENYGKIINQKHFDRLCGLLDSGHVIYGGERDAETLRIAPAIVSPCTWDDPLMEEEIFGPILPVLTYKHLDDALELIRQRPHPLAMYLFTRDKQSVKKVVTGCAFGGGCVNDTMVHLASTRLPFGGVGESGMGAYHGKTGFDTFTHYKAIVTRKNWLDLPMRYQPYTGWKEKLVRLFLR